MAAAMLVVAVLVSSVLAGPSFKITNPALRNATVGGALDTSVLAGPSRKITNPPWRNATVGGLVSSSSVFLGSRLESADDHAADENSTNPQEGPVAASKPKSMEMTAREMEETVTQLMLGKSAFGATPMGDSVQKIVLIIKDTMEPKVEEAHESDQKQLIKLATDISSCGTEKAASLEVASVQLAKYDKESSAHQKCRGNEATMFTSKESCLAEQKSLREVKNLKCKAFAAIANEWGHVKNNAEIVKKGGSESVESYVTRLSNTFCGKHAHGLKGKTSRRGGWGGGLSNGMLDQYLRAKDACAKATKAWESKVKECKRKIHEYNNQKSQCNQFQTFMDGASCKRAVLAKDACEAYAGCYFNKKKAYTVVEGKVRFEEVDRKAEWRGLKRIGCLIDAFADGRVTNDEIGLCRNTTWSTANFTIDYPEIPPIDRCLVPNTYPATEFYKRKEFAPLPAVAKGRQSLECSGMEEISLTPLEGSPESCKCERVTMNGYYTAGPLVKCTGCLDVRKSTQKNSCPAGTKLFSPATRSDWKTFISSTEPLRDPHFIIDITRPQNGCGGCKKYPMDFAERRQKSWQTSDGSAWWLRSTPYSEPNGDYQANCYLRLNEYTSENHITFNDGNCNYHSKSYYCQLAKQSLTPKSGSPASCKCSSVILTGKYSAGSLVKCQHCLDVRNSKQKNSCPDGTKLFAPRTKGDWKTFFSSTAPLASPHFIIDVTRPQNGCGGCTRSPMKSTSRRQATWKTSDGAPWWLRDSKYSQPSGDYRANCYLGLGTKSADESQISFNDAKCAYHSTSYYCQPKMKKPENMELKLKKQEELKATVTTVITDNADMKTGFLEYQYYYAQNGRCRLGRDQRADTVRPITSDVDYAMTNEQKWSGFAQTEQYAAKWDGILFITTGGEYTFTIGSDDGSRLYIDKRSVINNDGYHSFQEKSAQKTVNPIQHKVSLMYFQGGGSHAISFKYKGPDTNNEVKVVPTTGVKYEKPQGFKEEVFYTGVKSRVADAITGEPQQTRVVQRVAFGSTERTWPGFLQSDGFGVRWTGVLNTYRGGRYRFWIKSDDGSMLYVGDNLLVNNDGPHGMRSRYGDKQLERKSDTNLRLEYFEARGGAGIYLKYMGPDTRNKLKTIRSKVVKAPF